MSMEEVDGAALGDVLSQESGGVLVDFWSPWCAPCRTLKPHLKRMAEEREDSWRFVAINAEENPEAVENYSVRGLPTVLLFKGGEELCRFSGRAMPSAIDEKLDEFAQ